MKELLLNVDNQGRVSPSNYSGFIVGEHNAGRIAVCFSNEDLPKCDYFRMYFETSNGQNVFSKELHEEDGYIYYDMPYDVTSLGHTLYWQLCGYKIGDEACSLIYKTEVIPISLGGSISGGGDLAEEEFVSELQVILDKLEGFDEKFNIQIGNVQSVSPTESPSVSIRKGDDYTYYLDFSLPAPHEIPDVPSIKKAYFSISENSWDANLTTVDIYNPNIAQTSLVILKPEPYSAEEFNNCNVTVYDQKDSLISFCCFKRPQKELSFEALIVGF